jgi:trans-aconitate methyltransferase
MTGGWDAAAYDSRFSFVTSLGAPLLDLLGAAAGDRVLDVGCGTGHQAAELAARGCVVTGLDADPAMVAAAREAHPEVPFVLGDAQRSVPAGPYDRVLSNAALHWMPDADAVCRNVRGALAPRGLFVAELGGQGNVSALTAAIQAARAGLGLGAADGRWYFPSPAEHAGRLESAGFTVRMIERYERPTPLAAGDTAADWARMFGQALLVDVPDAVRADFDAAVDAHAAAAGLRGPDGGWTADYVRVRFIAVAA